MNTLEIKIPNQKKIKRVLWVGDMGLFRYVFDYKGAIYGDRQQANSRAFIPDRNWDVQFYAARILSLTQLQGMTIDLAYYPDSLPRKLIEDIERRLDCSNGSRIIITEEEE